jgi:hypothetical protein
MRDTRDEVHALIIEGGKALKTYRQTHKITPDQPDQRHMQLMLVAGEGRREIMDLPTSPHHGIDSNCIGVGGHLLRVSTISEQVPSLHGYRAHGILLTCDICNKSSIVPLLDALVALIKTGQNLGILDEVPLLP